MTVEWCRANYEKTRTAPAWTATPDDAGWDGSAQYGEDLPASPELRAIFDEEMTLGDVPEWAVTVLDRMNTPLNTRGHATFHRPLLEICEAIDRERPPEFVTGCYTAPPERKLRMAMVVYCLDVWLKEAPLGVAKAELALRDNMGQDWPEIVGNVYDTLGDGTPHNRGVAERLIHRLRWWIKTLIWPGDQRHRFQLDVFSGDVCGNQQEWGCYGNPPYGDPYFAELRLPRVESLAARTRDGVPDGGRLIERIESMWLCAPKTFRYVERIVMEIGRLGSHDEPDYTRSVLHCEDTIPEFVAAKACYERFQASLGDWLDRDADAMPELGTITPAKHWLVRLFRHKLRLYERHNNFGNLVGACASGDSSAGGV